MPAVFVHGNPESEAIWYPLVASLARHGIDDVLLLSPPGFGAPTPAGWDASMASYRRWLTAELQQIATSDQTGAVDLVGHDWGAGHVLGAMAERPDLVRSFATDCAALIHPDYVWHDMAQLWQTPDTGEQIVDAMMGMPRPDRIAGYMGLGLPEDVAAALADAASAEMGRCILALYRDAAQPAVAELGVRVVAALEGRTEPARLTIDATLDPYVPSDLSRQTAASIGATVATLEGLGHWWMVEDPDAAADALVNFWSTL